MLDGKQRKQALLGDSRKEQQYKTVKLTGKKEGLEGIRLSELSRDSASRGSPRAGGHLGALSRRRCQGSHETHPGERLQEPAHGFFQEP